MNQRLVGMAIFALVVEEGSFAGAARRLDRSPSVVSTRVRELERSFEVRLLHRTTRRLALTLAGARYLPHCQAVLDALREAEALGELLRTTVAGRLRVTAPSALIETLVAPILARLLDAHPEVEVELDDSDTRANLDGGELEVAIRVGPLTELEHRVRRLGELRDVRVGRPGRPDRAIVLPWQDRAPLASAGILRVRSVLAARALTERGLGWAILPEPAVRDLLDRGALEGEGEGQPAVIHAVHGFGSQPPAAVRAFVDAAVVVAAGLV